MKICKNCQITSENFRKHKGICKSCESKRKKEWWNSTKEKRLEVSKNWREANKEHNLTRSKRWYFENKDKQKEKLKVRYKENRETLLIQTSKYKRLNREKINARERHRRQSSPEYRLKYNLRSRIWNALKNQLLIKDETTLFYIGCTIEQLKAYLESKFKPEMSWENYGKFGWHVDHIRPLATFDLSNEEERQIAFNYKNLQPLWWKENLSKGSRVHSNT